MQFKEIIQKIFSAPKKKEVGTKFELLCKDYLLKADPDRFKMVKLWDENWPTSIPKPNSIDLKGRDTGIDLIAMDTKDQIWAIQAKAKKDCSKIYKKDIDSFIADTVVRKIDRRIIITTASDLSNEAKKYKEKTGFDFVAYDDLNNARIDWLEETLNTVTQISKKTKIPLAKQKPERWMSFEKSREYASALKLRNHKAWLLFIRRGKKRPDIPANPSVTYRNKDWCGWGDFLGTGNVRKRNWLKFEDAHQIVLNLKLKSEKGWRKYCQQSDRQKNIPTQPHKVYAKSGWKSWTHWLTGKDKRGKWREYAYAKSFACALKLKTNLDWKKYVKGQLLPTDIPKSPATVYKKNGWVSWGNFLGTGGVSPAQPGNFKTYKEVQHWTVEKKITSCNQWRMTWQQERPKGIPANPDKVYKNKEWKSWGDFLGTGRQKSGSIKWLSFKKARSYVRKKMGLTSRSEWNKNKNELPKDIPRTPAIVYKNSGWQGWEDFLGYRQSKITKSCSSD